MFVNSKSTTRILIIFAVLFFLNSSGCIIRLGWAAESEIDKIVQQNVSNAGETTATSEEMSAQAEELKSIVNTLETIINGAVARKIAHKQGSGQRAIHRQSEPLGQGQKARVMANVDESVKMIPFDDETEFENL